MADTSKKNKVSLYIDPETEDVEKKLDELEKRPDTLTVNAAADTSAAEAALDALTTEKTVTVTPDTVPAQAAIDALPAEKTVTVTPEADPAQAAIDALPAEKTVTVTPEADPAQAQAVLNAIPETKTVTVDADTAPAQAAIDALPESLQKSSTLLVKLRGYLDSLIGRVKTLGTAGRKSGTETAEGMKTAERSTVSMTAAVGRLTASLGGVFAVGRIIAFGRACVSASSEASDALQGLASIVSGQGRSFSDAQGWIESYISDGLVPMTDAVTAYKNLAARGYDDTQIRSVLTALKDSAAYGRQASYTLGEAVASATEGLKNENSILVDNAGVTKNVAKMWEEYAKSIGTTSASLTQAQKIQAEVNGILTETRFQTGDAARVANTFSGQIAQLNAALVSLKNVVGDLLRTAILPLIEWITKAATAVTDFLEIVRDGLGIDSGLSSGIAQAAANTDGLTASLETAKAAADMLRAASFDDFNVIGSEQQTAAPDLQSTVLTLDAQQLNTGLAEVQDNLDSTQDKIQQIEQAFSQTTIGDAWLHMWEDVGEGDMDEFWDSWRVGLDEIFPGWNKFWESVGGALYEGVQAVGGFFANIGAKWVNFWGSVGGALYEGVQAVGGFFANIGAKWVNFWGSVGGALYEGVQAVGGFFANIGAKWVNFWESVGGALYEGVQAVGGFFANIGAKWVNFWESVGEAIYDGWAFLTGIFGNIGRWFSARFSEAWRAVTGAFSGIGRFFSGVWNNITGVFGNVAGWFKDQFTKAWENVKAVFSAGGRIFSGIKDGILNGLKAVINGLIDGINTVIKVPFDGINWALNAIKGIDILGIKPFEWIAEIGVPQIPKLAKGGIVSQPTLAMVGDNPGAAHDPEVVSPLSKLTQMLGGHGETGGLTDARFAALMAKIDRLIQAIEDKDMTVRIGDKDIHTAHKRYEQRVKKMKGVISC